MSLNILANYKSTSHNLKVDQSLAWTRACLVLGAPEIKPKILLLDQPNVAVLRKTTESRAVAAHLER